MPLREQCRLKCRELVLHYGLRDSSDQILRGNYTKAKQLKNHRDKNVAAECDQVQKEGECEGAREVQKHNAQRVW